MNVYAKVRCAPLRIKKALGIFREQITRTTTLRKIGVGFPTFRGVPYVQPLGYD